MDDISVIALITILKQLATFIQQRNEDIGLSLNISKCLIIGHEPIDFFINDVNVPFINYDQSGFRFLECVVRLSHILNCKYFVTYRSIVHDSVRDQLYAMCKRLNIEAFIEPLVRKLSLDQTDDSFGKRRADLVAPGIDGVLNVVDVVSIDVCKNSAARLVYSAN
ncbi:hypothetical protein P9112_014240 [Eukaryota sp. TZLM1-RC]